MKCDNCKWFVLNLSKKWQGSCHLRPPVPMYYHARVHFERPEVKLEDFCSHFQERS